jgi:hypothetical protein
MKVKKPVVAVVVVVDVVVVGHAFAVLLVHRKSCLWLRPQHNKTEPRDQNKAHAC